VYVADPLNEANEVAPPPSLRKYWTRKAIAEWLAERLSETSLTLVGIDHGFSFPLRYFEIRSDPRLTVFLNDFQEHWPTDEDRTYVDFVRDGLVGMVRLVAVILAGDGLRKCALGPICVSF